MISLKLTRCKSNKTPVQCHDNDSYIATNTSYQLTWTVEGIAGSCFICWSNPFTVFSLVLWGGVVTLSCSNLFPSPTSCTAGCIGTPVAVPTVN